MDGINSTTQVETVVEEPKPEPVPIDIQIKGEIIRSLSLAFPALAYFKNALDAAKKNNLNIVLPVVFTPDGRIAIQEPILVNVADMNVPDPSKPQPQSDGEVVVEAGYVPEAPQAEAEAPGDG